MPLRLGGRSGDPAITWRGRTLTYAEFETAVLAAPTGEPGSDPVDVSGLAIPQALACVFAAARRGSAVLVRDPGLPQPILGPLPPGTWLVACTSGTTSAPRAVCRTAASWAASVEPLAELAGLSRSDSVLLTGPLHATLHLHAAVHTLAIGAELTDDRERATAAHVVPTALESLLDASPPAAARLQRIVVAGAALPARVARRAPARGLAVTEYYGAAELSFVAARRLPDPVLRPFRGVCVRIDGDGMLWARSPYLALGYPSGGAALCRPAAQLATVPTAALRVDTDGFATVGDRAEVPQGDPALGIVIRGRGRTAITTGGSTVLVEDVEAALAEVPGVRGAAVVGTSHARLGEIVTAVVVLTPGTVLKDVRAAARRLLTMPARPRRYIVVDALPRTGGGKIARVALRDLANRPTGS